MQNCLETIDALPDATHRRDPGSFGNTYQEKAYLKVKAARYERSPTW